MTKTHLGLIAALIVVAALAIAGWVRRPEASVPAYSSSTEPTAGPLSATPSPAYDTNEQPAGGASSGTQEANAPAAVYPESSGMLPSFAVPRYVRTVRSEQPPAPVYEADREYDTRYVERDSHERRRHHHRSAAHSAEIVAGSAGVGAAVGAIAGGGKGAGIGALAGGAGGFIYDRLTHDR